MAIEVKNITSNGVYLHTLELGDAFMIGSTTGILIQKESVRCSVLLLEGIVWRQYTYVSYQMVLKAKKQELTLEF